MPKLGPSQVKLARQMYEGTGDDGKRKYTVQQIADESASPAPPSTDSCQDDPFILTSTTGQWATECLLWGWP
jgi:hypothetical protein